ncbi:MAG: HlyD family efflux transporter periplasmic adaptor subunit [Chlorobi bacterium]|nr:HlyD family efflux transporter periplasmic adaptor subunit [Chlorobiota bacterium]
MFKNPFIRWGTIVIVAGLVIFFATRKKIIDTKEITVPVQFGKFVSVVYSTGQLKAENSTSINLPKEISSRRLGIYEIKVISLVEEGTVVDSGDWVATLDYSAVEEQRNKYYDAWEQAYNAWEDAKLDTTLEMSNLRDDLLNGKVQLEEKKLILSQSIYESPAIKRQAKLDVERAERDLKQKIRNYKIKKKQGEYKVYRSWEEVKTAKERLDDVDKLIEKLEVKAPKPGMVIYSYDRFGKKIKAGSSISRWRPKIAELPDLTSMISKSFINEIDISKIKTGQPVKVGIDAFPEKHFDGEVTSVANIGQVLPGGDSKVFEITIKVKGSDPDLKPAMTTSNIITTDVLDSVLFIPLEAVFANDTVQFVYIKNDDEITKQIIDPGEENENYVVVNNGLEKNMTLMLNEPKDAGKLPLKGAEIYEQILQRKKEKLDKLKEKIKETEAEKQTNKEPLPGNATIITDKH